MCQNDPTRMPADRPIGSIWISRIWIQIPALPVLRISSSEFHNFLFITNTMQTTPIHAEIIQHLHQATVGSPMIAATIIKQRVSRHSYICLSRKASDWVQIPTGLISLPFKRRLVWIWYQFDLRRQVFFTYNRPEPEWYQFDCKMPKHLVVLRYHQKQCRSQS